MSKRRDSVPFPESGTAASPGDQPWDPLDSTPPGAAASLTPTLPGRHPLSRRHFIKAVIATGASVSAISWLPAPALGLRPPPATPSPA